MRRPLAIAVCIIAGASIGVLIVRLWKSRKYAAPYTRNFASKYAEIIKGEGKESVEHSDEIARLMVIYGSSSGNAEAYAKNLVSNLKERGADVALIDPSSWAHLSQFNSQQALFPVNDKGESPIVIFIVATTGEGEVPANFYCLFAEMQSTLQRGGTEGKMPFSDISYAVFALGDSSYKYFCRGGLFVNMLLKKGGGKELLPVGIGDARNPLQEDVFEEWEEKLMGILEERCEIVLTEGSDAPPKPQLVFQFTPEKPVSPLPFIPPPSLLEPSVQNPVELVIKEKTPRTIKRDDGSFILHLVLSIEDYTITYQAGDHLGIYPANLPDIIEAYRVVLNISEKEWMTPVELCTTANARSRASLRNTFPARVTLRTVFERYLDLHGKPRKSMLRVLAKYCSNPNEKDLFIELLNRDTQKNKKKDNSEIDTPTTDQIPTFNFRTLLDYLKHFPSCCSIPIAHFLEMMPRIQPRYYSIASDMMTHPKTVEVFIRIVTDGMNSKYLQSLSVGEKITAFIHKSTFHLPAKCGERPVVMIGPGTGVASMVGFCYRRAALMKKQPNASFGPMVLFFGAHKRETEYFVQEELEEWCPQGEGKLATGDDVSPPPVLTLLDLAFSRDQCEKYYVTNLIEKHKDYIFKLLTSTTNGGCLLYVSGNASEMAKSVDQALVDLLVYGGMTRSAASKFLQSMENEHKFMKDVY